ncbi:TPA: glycosyl transferase [Candidatus Dependentiae bacterium]|nr:MAG: hypothetical protein UR14_C0002G0097 [candidate division TM6 bacterium GW2011_GWE2_31_21]KKP53894.1 MAG: hypothetical protein UR43_C0002G0097 [candidate division TM6 bacterium GW2011_GWF2_33_332]HBS47674.1 glycosyl transferase [Candidatus Dependentiae bacterium]HBZ73823.1 glycosyl transferase [Candidatus Dependentiae bacterium]
MLQAKREYKTSDAYWINKNKYYYDRIANFYKFVIPKNSSVLQIGCRSGFLLNAVKPSFGLGIDENINYISEAKEKCPNLNFVCGSVDDLLKDSKYSNNKFDFIILSHTLMLEYDIQICLEKLHQFCNPQTRIVLNICSTLWEPFLKLGQSVGLRRDVPFRNWIQMADLENFLNLASFEIVSNEYRTLMPKYIPLISTIFNYGFAILPLVNRCCLDFFVIACPKPQTLDAKELTCSVIVTCKNEKGNIVNVVNSIPKMGKKTEIIFVEGGSKDGTLDEIKKVVDEKKSDLFFDLKYFVQGGKGKADAVRVGFDNASGDILMILDGDLTVPAQELTKFWNAIVDGKGEFVNGVRLIYAMENSAMRFLNLIANKLFGIGFSWLLNQRIRDTLCGTKVIFKKDWQKIKTTRKFLGDIDPFGDFDLIFGAIKNNLKVVDMPIHYKARTYGSTQISRFKHGLMLLKMSFVAFKKFKMK